MIRLQAGHFPGVEIVRGSSAVGLSHAVGLPSYRLKSHGEVSISGGQEACTDVLQNASSSKMNSRSLLQFHCLHDLLK